MSLLLNTAAVIAGLLFTGLVTETVLRIAGYWPAEWKEGFDKMYCAGAGIVIVATVVALFPGWRKAMIGQQWVLIAATGAVTALTVWIVTRPAKQRT